LTTVSREASGDSPDTVVASDIVVSEPNTISTVGMSFVFMFMVDSPEITKSFVAFKAREAEAKPFSIGFSTAA